MQKALITAAVFSDSHGSTARMKEAVRRLQPDVILHLGDCEHDAELLRLEFPQIPLYNVCGNCDFAPLAPEKETVQLGPVTAFLTHGHLYSVKWGRLDYIAYAAMEAGAQLALFGHTHEAYNGEMGGVKLLNPGTAGVGRDLTYGVVQVFENGGIACEIREL